MKTYWIFLILFSINASFANNHSQIIYQYKNQHNVTEFTDTPNSEKKLKQVFEIKKTSLEQQQKINHALEKVRAFNNDFNKRYYDNKKREFETAKRNAEEKKRAEQKAKAAHARDVSKLTRHHRHEHQRRDAVWKKKGKKGHSKLTRHQQRDVIRKTKGQTGRSY